MDVLEDSGIELQKHVVNNISAQATHATSTSNPSEAIKNSQNFVAHSIDDAAKGSQQFGGSSSNPAKDSHQFDASSTNPSTSVQLAFILNELKRLNTEFITHKKKVLL